MQNLAGPVRQAIAVAVLVLALLGTWACTSAATEGSTSSSTAAADAPACVDSGKGLFNDCALLDTSRVDDLRADPDSQCLAAQGLMLSTGQCVDAVLLYEDETDADTWRSLEETGFDHGLDCDEVDCLWVPAAYVLLDDEEVVSVDTTRSLTPRS